MRHLRILSIAATAFSLLSPLGTFAHDVHASCPIAVVKCFAPGDESSSDAAASESPAIPQGLVVLQVRKAMIGGPFAHKWVQVGTSEDAVTFGYGAANIPIIDAGQVVVTDNKSVDVVSKWHLFPWHVTPTERPAAGRLVGGPILVTDAQAQKLIDEQRRHRFVAPYIPLFNDCHTYVCSVTAKAQGKSTLPCYLLFRGHF